MRYSKRAQRLTEDFPKTKAGTVGAMTSHTDYDPKGKIHTRESYWHKKWRNTWRGRRDTVPTQKNSNLCRYSAFKEGAPNFPLLNVGLPNVLLQRVKYRRGEKERFFNGKSLTTQFSHVKKVNVTATHILICALWVMWDKNGTSPLRSASQNTYNHDLMGRRSEKFQ